MVTFFCSFRPLREDAKQWVLPEKVFHSLKLLPGCPDKRSHMQSPRFYSLSWEARFGSKHRGGWNSEHISTSLSLSLISWLQNKSVQILAPAYCIKFFWVAFWISAKHRTCSAAALNAIWQASSLWSNQTVTGVTGTVVWLETFNWLLV